VPPGGSIGAAASEPVRGRRKAYSAAAAQSYPVGMTEVWSQYGHKDQSQPAVRIPTPAAVLWDTLSRTGDEWSGASQGRIARSSLEALRTSRRTVKKNGVAARSAVQHAVAADGCRRKANLNELARLEAPRPELLDGLEPLERVERLRELLVPAPRGSPPMPLKAHQASLSAVWPGGRKGGPLLSTQRLFRPPAHAARHGGANEWSTLAS
jgi:hypothetical protein